MSSRYSDLEFMMKEDLRYLYWDELSIKSGKCKLPFLGTVCKVLIMT